MKNKTRNNKSTCYTNPDGNKFWQDRKGQFHRKIGPAIEYANANGDKAWRVNGKRHREDGPAVEYVNGHKEWWVNGRLHRRNGPAIEYTSGDKAWYIDGKRHREDGPAVEYADGYPSADGCKEWWINDVQYHTEKEYWLKIYEMKLITKKELFLKLL